MGRRTSYHTIDILATYICIHTDAHLHIRIVNVCTPTPIVINACALSHRDIHPCIYTHTLLRLRYSLSVRTLGRSQAFWPGTCSHLSFLSEVASLMSDCPGLEAVGCLAVVGRSWHPTRQPSQVQGVWWEGG